MNQLNSIQLVTKMKQFKTIAIALILYTSFVVNEGNPVVKPGDPIQVLHDTNGKGVEPLPPGDDHPEPDPLTREDPPKPADDDVVTEKPEPPRESEEDQISPKTTIEPDDETLQDPETQDRKLPRMGKKTIV